MELSELVGKTLLIKTVRSIYRNGAEHLSISFEDSTNGDKFIVSLTAERGSDLWMTTKKIWDSNENLFLLKYTHDDIYRICHI